jgi:hypothetical protein
MKTIGIIGTRRRDTHNDYLATLRVFKKIYRAGDIIVSGGCSQGGDRFAEVIAKSMQVPIMIHYAQWNTYGKSAGFRRNGDIARQADILIAVVAKDRTGGTEDTLKKYNQTLKEEVILI